MRRSASLQRTTSACLHALCFDELAETLLMGLKIAIWLLCAPTLQRTLITRHETDLKDNMYWLGLLTHLQVRGTATAKV